MPLRRRRRAHPPSSRRARSGVIAAGLTAALAVPLTGGSPASADHTELPERVTLMGSLMDELGCGTDWDENCDTTDLPATGGGNEFSATFEVPAGAYEAKVRLDGSWEENYGAGGVANGPNIPLVLLEPARLTFTYDHDTHVLSVTPADLASGEVTAEDRDLARTSLREELTDERFYFVMADRFANGDTANDTGGYGGDVLTHGYDPTDRSMYHGGDIAGIMERLDYIEGLGTTAIWLTPSFKNEPVQEVAPGDFDAGYHGYWVTDFTQIDPHLGTNEELKELIDLAHDRGIKVFFDIITNHTADVLTYPDEACDTTLGRFPYISKEQQPYLTAGGEPFDDSEYADGEPPFPPVDAETTFPYTPVVPEGEEDAKTPGWLNDPTMYHNRGTSTFSGEDALYGDFPSGVCSGLDDLWTERPEVVQGMIDIYKTWVEDAGIDGFRIDTVKHVNIEFWQQFAPALEGYAASLGNDDFFMFGEVYDTDPSFVSRYTTEGRMQAAVDFGFQGSATSFAKGDATTGLRNLFVGDDWFTDADSNVYSLPTFLGNHDMGRIGYFLEQDYDDPQQLLERDQLAHSLMYLTRGQPVVYYGDEQGFTGDGGDQLARQDMFASQTPEYLDDDSIGTDATPAEENFDPEHPLYQHIAALAALRDAHPTLADGAQIHRYASGSAGIYAFSRIDAEELREYVVAVNNSDEAQTASFDTFVNNQRLQPVWPAGGTAIRAGQDGFVTVTVPARSAVVYRSDRTMTPDTTAPEPFFRADAGTPVSDRAEIAVGVPGEDFNQVTLAWRPVGGDEWTYLGTDDNEPYRVFHDVSGMADGTMLEYRAIARDHDGDLGVATTWAVVGDAPAATGGLVVDSGDVTQPNGVAVPGAHNQEIGCANDWDPACPEIQLSFDAEDQVWSGTFDVPASSSGWEYKAALNGSWDENYGQGAVRNGSNILHFPDGATTYYYDHRTHWVTSTAQVPIVTAFGDFQDEIGCSSDSDPGCMRSWLQDPDGDGSFVYATTRIPAGTYGVQVAHGQPATEVFGAGGVQDGDPLSFTVPEEEGVVTVFRYDPATHALSVTFEEPASPPDLEATDAHVVNDGRWVLWNLPEDRRGWTYRLHYGAPGSLGLDVEAVTGGDGFPLFPIPMPEAVLRQAPQYEGWEAFAVPKAAQPHMSRILQGQVAVAAYDDLGRLVAATGVQVVPGR